MRHYPSDRVDLRSDTVTQPTSEMRKIMSSAIVGDDVLGDDSTVNELQEYIARILGKEAALFVPSGTMSNAIAIKSQTKPGDEIVTHKKSHIYLYEGGGYASLAGCSVSLVGGDKGIMSPGDVKSAIRKSEGSQSHYPNCSLICVENTANMGGGSLYPIDVLDSICQIAHDNNCRAHLDGARLFNATVASNISPDRMVKNFDTISICLSKGLGSPVGSLLVGDSETIAEAHRWRKIFGGGMRQSGILAAAGLYALKNNIDRLHEDHSRAFKLAKSVNSMNGFEVDISSVQSNMAYITCQNKSASTVVSELGNLGIDVLSINEDVVRAVTHLHITDEDISRTIDAFKTISN
tara:strand:- start:6213 stop:7262 length:1050 start_codon:yes stop_codon:yes gene_type:complete